MTLNWQLARIARSGRPGNQGMMLLLNYWWMLLMTINLFISMDWRLSQLKCGRGWNQYTRKQELLAQLQAFGPGSILLHTSGGKVQFEPEPSRTELQVQFKVWKFFWTEPQVQFGVQPKLLWFELVRTMGFSRAIKAEILVIPNQILDLQTTFGLWLTNIDLIDDKIYFRMVI